MVRLLTMEILEKVKKILGAQVNRKKINPDDINENTDLKSLGLDSLDIAEVIINIEQEFSLPEISQNEMINLKTVKDVEELIKKHQK